METLKGGIKARCLYADACACNFQGARSVGGRHVGLFWTLTGLLTFVWCAATSLAVVQSKVSRMCKVLGTCRYITSLGGVHVVVKVNVAQQHRSCAF